MSFGSSRYEAPEGGSVQVSVTLSADPERELSIPLSRTHLGGASEADYSGVPEHVAFGSGETLRTFEFAAADDSEEDFGESVLLALGDLPSRVIGGSETTVSILDDDTPPRAVFDLDGAECDGELCRAVAGEPVRFADVSTGPAARRRWEFGEGTESTRRSPVHGWTEPGFYEVTLWVSDGGERESRSSRVFLVESGSPAGSCEPSAERRCLRDSRYAAVVVWRDGAGAGGRGMVVRVSQEEVLRWRRLPNRAT